MGTTESLLVSSYCWKHIMAEAGASDAPSGSSQQGQPQLATQDAATLDPSTLPPLSPDVIARQATINIGTIGHVAHGKSTLVKAISGVQTVRFKNELERNITIKLGYANAKVYKCDSPTCPKPASFRSCGSSKEDVFACERAGCSGKFRLVRHISFVDCPGHDILMATMLNGAAVMDAALLLVAGNESCPQPQTSEHLAAIEIMRLQHILIMQNKVDLIKQSQAEEQHKQILGVKTEGKSKASKVAKLTKGEVLMLNIGSLSTGGRITAVNQDLAKVLLSAPVCARIGDKIALSRRLKSSWRLVGWGSVKRGKALE